MVLGFDPSISSLQFKHAHKSHNAPWPYDVTDMSFLWCETEYCTLYTTTIFWSLVIFTNYYMHTLVALQGPVKFPWSCHLVCLQVADQKTEKPHPVSVYIKSNQLCWYVFKQLSKQLEPIMSEGWQLPKAEKNHNMSCAKTVLDRNQPEVIRPIPLFTDKSFLVKFNLEFRAFISCQELCITLLSDSIERKILDWFESSLCP